MHLAPLEFSHKITFQWPIFSLWEPEAASSYVVEMVPFVLGLASSYWLLGAVAVLVSVSGSMQPVAALESTLEAVAVAGSVRLVAALETALEEVAMAR